MAPVADIEKFAVGGDHQFGGGVVRLGIMRHRADHLDFLQRSAVDGIDADFGIRLMIDIEKFAVRRHLDAARARAGMGLDIRADRRA